MSAVRDAYRNIYETSSKSPWPSPDAPWCLVVRSHGYRDVRVECVMSDGYTFPNVNYGMPHPHNRHWRTCYVGGRRSGWMKKILPQAVSYRDTMNLIHQVTNKKIKLTEEDMKLVTDPALKMKLVEAVCLSVA